MPRASRTPGHKEGVVGWRAVCTDEAAAERDWDLTSHPHPQPAPRTHPEVSRREGEGQVLTHSFIQGYVTVEKSHSSANMFITNSGSARPQLVQGQKSPGTVLADDMAQERCSRQFKKDVSYLHDVHGSFYSLPQAATVPNIKTLNIKLRQFPLACAKAKSSPLNSARPKAKIRHSCNILSKSNRTALHSAKPSLVGLSASLKDSSLCVDAPPQSSRDLSNHIDELTSGSHDALEGIPEKPDSCATQVLRTGELMGSAVDKCIGFINIEESPTIHIFSNLHQEEADHWGEREEEEGSYSCSEAVVVSSSHRIDNIPSQPSTTQAVISSQALDVHNTGSEYGGNILPSELECSLDLPPSALQSLNDHTWIGNSDYNQHGASTSKCHDHNDSVINCGFVGLIDGLSAPPVPIANADDSSCMDDGALQLFEKLVFDTLPEAEDNCTNDSTDCQGTPQSEDPAGGDSLLHDDQHIPYCQGTSYFPATSVQPASVRAAETPVLSNDRSAFDKLGVLPVHLCGTGGEVALPQLGQVVWTAQGPKPSIAPIVTTSTEGQGLTLGHLPGAAGNPFESIKIPTVSPTGDFMSGASLINDMEEDMNERVFVNENIFDTQGCALEDQSTLAHTVATLATEGSKENLHAEAICQGEETPIQMCSNSTTVNQQTCGDLPVLSWASRSLPVERDSASLSPVMNDLALDAECDIKELSFLPDQDLNTLLHLCSTTSGKVDDDEMEKEKSQGPDTCADEELESLSQDIAHAFPQKTYQDSNSVSDINDLLDSLFQDTEDETTKSVFNHNVGISPKLLSAGDNGQLQRQTDIVKETHNTRSSFAGQRDGCVADPVVAQMMGEQLGSDCAVLVPVTTCGQLHVGHTESSHVNCLITNADSRVPKSVSFRTLPASRPLRCPVRKAVSAPTPQLPLSTVSLTPSKKKQQEPYRENPKYLKILPRTNSGIFNQKGQVEPSSNYLSLTAPLTSESKEGMWEKTKLVLPVGKTGMSITIPMNAPTSVKSFVSPTVSISSTSSATIPPAKDPYPKLVTAEPEVVIVTASLPAVTPTLKIKLPLQRSTPVQAQDKRKVIRSPTVIALGNASIPTGLKYPHSCVPSVLLTPVSGQSLLPCTVPQDASTQSGYDPPVSSYNNLSAKSAVSRCTLRSSVHSFVSGSVQVKSVVCSTVNPPLSSTSTVQPVKILINTNSNPRKSVATSTASTETRVGDVEELETGTVDTLQQKILKRKPYPDSIKKFNKALRDDLRALLPVLPESVLNALQPPHQAVCRGYFSVKDLKTLHAQALDLHLNTIFQDHACTCTNDNCATCFSFLQQRKSLSQVKRERYCSHKSRGGGRGGNLRKPHRGRGRRGRRGSRGGHTECKAESNCKLQCLLSSKRKFDVWEETRFPDITFKRVKWGNKIETKESLAFVSENKDRLLCGGARHRRCSSESDLCCGGVEIVKDEKAQSCDDSFLTLCRTTLLPSKYQTRNCPLYKSSEEITTDSHVNIWNSQQWDVVQKTVAMDQKLKEKLEIGHLPYSEQHSTESKRNLTRSQAFDVLSLSIGTLNIATQQAPFCQPKLQVDYSARKIMYAFEVQKHWKSGGSAVEGSKGGRSGAAGKTSKMEGEEDQGTASSQREGKGAEAVTSLQDDTAPQLVVVIDIPFSTLQALSITSNKMLLVVNAMPTTQLVAWVGGSCATLSGQQQPVSPDCRSHLAHIKALLAVFPLHKVLMEQRKGLTLGESLTGFSPWFKQMLSQPFPIHSDHTPSWALASLTPPPPPPPPPLSPPPPPPPPDQFYTTTTTTPPTTPCTPPLPGITPISADPICPHVSTAPPDVSPPNTSAVNSALASTPSGKTQQEDTVTGPSIQPPHADQKLLGHATKDTQSIIPREGGKLVKGWWCPSQQGESVDSWAKGAVTPPTFRAVQPSSLYMVSVVKAALRAQMAGLCSLLMSHVILPCCGGSPELLHIIPGTVECSWCGMAVSYSWCSHHIHLQTLCPRNHCLVCCCCRPAIHTHCQNCEQCTQSISRDQCGDCGSCKF